MHKMVGGEINALVLEVTSGIIFGSSSLWCLEDHEN